MTTNIAPLGTAFDLQLPANINLKNATITIALIGYTVRREDTTLHLQARVAPESQTMRENLKKNLGLNGINCDHI